LPGTEHLRHTREEDVTTCAMISGLKKNSVVDPDPGRQRAKTTHKNRKVNKFHFLKSWMFSFEGLRILL
jgi:hypothetical protein